MKWVSNRWAVYTVSSLCFIAAGLSLFLAFYEKAEDIEAAKVQQIHEIRSSLTSQLGPFFLNNQFPQTAELKLDDKKENVRIHYTIDPDLQKESDSLLKSYKPDYGAVVVMNANTGQILALSSFQKNDPNAPNLALRGSYPAASIFKIVTAGAAVDKYKLSPDTLVMFNGGNHTLYKKNVMSTKISRWTREMTLRDAFAQSINTVFGRLTLEKMKPSDLEEYAMRFGFNRHIQSDLPFDTGFTEIPKEKSFELTELASGYNRVTRMSPIQGAMIAASIAEDGVMRVPYVVEKIESQDGKTLFQAEPVTAAVSMSAQGAERLRVLMEATIKAGTSKKSFRNLVRDRKFKELLLGGKTGSLTGTNPKGKVDWFVGYAIGEKDTLAVAAITVNVNYWTVKSSHLAQSMFRKHFKEQFSRDNEKFFSASAADSNQ